MGGKASKEKKEDEKAKKKLAQEEKARLAQQAKANAKGKAGADVKSSERSSSAFRNIFSRKKKSDTKNAADGDQSEMDSVGYNTPPIMNYPDESDSVTRIPKLIVVTPRARSVEEKNTVMRKAHCAVVARYITLFANEFLKAHRETDWKVAGYNDTVNLVFSPVAVFTQLAMLAEGAEGSVRTALISSLMPAHFNRQSETYDGLGQLMKDFLAQLYRTESPKRLFEVGVFVDAAAGLRNEYETSIRNNYKSEVNMLEMKDSTAALDRMNQIMERRIRVMLPVNLCIDEFQFVIASSSLFDSTPLFDHVQHQKKLFTKSCNQGSCIVPTMRKMFEMKMDACMYASDPCYRIFGAQLDTATKKLGLAMYFVLPKEKNFDIRQIDIERVVMLADRARPDDGETVMVSIPRIRIATNNNLDNILGKTGNMKDAFRAEANYWRVAKAFSKERPKKGKTKVTMSKTAIKASKSEMEELKQVKEAKEEEKKEVRKKKEESKETVIRQPAGKDEANESKVAGDQSKAPPADEEAKAKGGSTPDIKAKASTPELKAKGSTPEAKPRKNDGNATQTKRNTTDATLHKVVPDRTEMTEFDFWETGSKYVGCCHKAECTIEGTPEPASEKQRYREYEKSLQTVDKERVKRGLPSRALQFKANRPFAYFVMHKTSKTLMLFGIVEDPTKLSVEPQPVVVPPSADEKYLKQLVAEKAAASPKTKKTGIFSAA